MVSVDPGDAIGIVSKYDRRSLLIIDKRDSKAENSEFQSKTLLLPINQRQ
jgi:hypothetical protein